MNFSSLSIKYPIPAIMLFVLLSLAGLLSFRGNVVQDFPDIELPMVTVSASLPGAAPAQLETEVARKIEDAVATLAGVKNVYTTVLDGSVTTTVEFALEKSIPEAVNDVRGPQDAKLAGNEIAKGIACALGPGVLARTGVDQQTMLDRIKAARAVMLDSDNDTTAYLHFQALAGGQYFDDPGAASCSFDPATLPN
jgi:hypothetical protein